MCVSQLTLKGRAVIHNANILSKLWYKVTVLGIPEQYADKLQVLINKFMWNEKMVLINKDTLELPHKDGSIQLVNVPIEVQSLRIKHIFQLLSGTSSHPWKSLAKYWLGTNLQVMKLFTLVNYWRGPVAETPNDYYQKCFEIFKTFISKLNTQNTDGNMQYHQLTALLFV